jgi:H+/gluconate symporter-like permease
MGLIPDKTSFNSLMENSERGNHLLRRASAESLGMIKNRGAVKSLIKALDDPYSEVSEAAMRARTAQGGTTVTMTTATAIIGPLLPALGVSPGMAAMTICAGAMMLMHVNDSFFWVVSGFTKMEVGTAYKTLTVIMAVMGLVAFACITLLGPLLGLA